MNPLRIQAGPRERFSRLIKMRDPEAELLVALIKSRWCSSIHDSAMLVFGFTSNGQIQDENMSEMVPDG